MDALKEFTSRYLPAVKSEPWMKYAAAGTAAVTGSLVLWKLYNDRGLPPGPRGGLFGATHLVNNETFEYDLAKLAKQYGDVFSVRLGPSLLIILASHSAIKDAFVKEGETFACRPLGTQIVLKILGFKDDIFATPYQTEGWNQNKAFILGCMRTAGFGQSKENEERILTETQKLYKYLEPSIEEGRPVNLRDILPKVTTNVIFQVIFSKEFGYEDPKLAEALKVIRAVTSGFGEGFSLEFVPQFALDLFYRNKIRAIRSNADDLRKIIRQEVDEHIANLDSNNPRDFVDLYLVKRGHDDMPRLIDNILMMIPDASDSLALIIEWVLLYMAYYRDVQKRMANEIEALTGGSRQVMWSDRNKLPYTEATIREVIRISPPFHMTAAHSVDKDTIFRGYRIPKEASVYGLMYSAHRDSAVYTDGETFNPERFLDSDGSVIRSDIWIPFGMGRRKCVGEQLSQIESFIVVANIIQRFDLQFKDGEKASLEPALGNIFKCPKPWSVVFNERTTKKDN